MAKSVSIWDCRELRERSEALIAKHHPHLADKQILYLRTDAKTKCQPKLLGPFERFLSSGDAESVDEGAELVLVVNDQDWLYVCDTGKADAMADHLLSHVEEQEDKDGEKFLAIVKHPIEEFHDVITRHGLWRSELRHLGDIVRQLELPAPTSRQAIDRATGEVTEVEITHQPSGRSVTLDRNTRANIDRSLRRLASIPGTDGVESITVSAPGHEPVTIDAEAAARIRGAARRGGS
jgi:hypothetical protein